FVPNAPLAPFPTDLTCDRCDNEISGSPVVSATTAIDGTFALYDVPSGSNIPLVIQNGRWRRAFGLPTGTECRDQQAGVQIRVPKNHTEGDIPRMAVTTGGYDALECLVRKMGIDDAEITPGGGTGRVHLYVSNGEDRIGNVGAANLPSAVTWWGLATENVDT